jgi:type II secretory pathway component PulF
MRFKVKFQENGKIKTKEFYANSLQDLFLLEDFPTTIIKIKKVQHFSLGIKNNTDVYYSFFNELLILLKSHLTLQESIELLQEYQKSPQVIELIDRFLLALSNGKNISDEVKKIDKIHYLIPYFLDTAQRNGNYIDAIEGLCEILLQRKLLKEKLIKVMWYPLVLLCTLIICITVMLFFVLPEFEFIFSQFGNDLPFVTQSFLLFKEYMENFYIHFFIGLFLVIIFLFFIYKFNKKLWDTIMFNHLFFISRLYRLFLYYQLFLTIDIALKSKHKIVDILLFSKYSTSNLYLRAKIENIIKLVHNGTLISKAFEKQNIFDTYILRILKIGDNNNNYKKSFEMLINIVKSTFDKKIDKSSQILEPLLILILGIFLLFIMIAVLSPVWEFSKIA